jgi:phosphatidate cytidylyltransferase
VATPSQSKPKSNDLAVRILSGLIVILLSVAFGFIGGWWFTLFVVVIIGLATYELWRLFVSTGYQASLPVMLLTAAAAFVGIRFPNLFILAPALSLVLLATLAWQLRRAQVRTFGDWAVSFAGGFYLGWTGGHLADVRELPNGWWWLVTMLVAVWLTDSGAYLFGRLFGRHKLAPAISPGKTWEGYLGGALLGTAGGAIVGALTPVGITAGAVTGLLVGALSVFGDLIESMIKRQAHAKDSGHLIPGHGGVLDRIDSLLWASVITFYVGVFFTQQLP